MDEQMEKRVSSYFKKRSEEKTSTTIIHASIFFERRTKNIVSTKMLIINVRNALTTQHPLVHIHFPRKHFLSLQFFFNRSDLNKLWFSFSLFENQREDSFIIFN